MFESALLQALQGDTTLATFLSTYKSKSAVFTEFAPQDAVLPYLIFRISRFNGLSPAAVQRFNIVIDIYDNLTSYKNIRAASERVEHLLDRSKLQHDRYGAIRIFFDSGGEVDEISVNAGIREYDPRSIHHNMIFRARAGRKKWSENQTTLGY
jgi:hypothetical protein